MLTALFDLQQKRLRRYVKKRGAAGAITAGLFLLVFCGVAWGIYKFFAGAFSYLNNFSFFRAALTLYAYEIFFLLIAFLVFVGAVISLLFGLFKNSRVAWLVASPRFKILPAYSLWSAILSSAWIFLFVLLPALAAGGVVFHLGWGAIVLGLLDCLCLLMLMVFLAYAFIFLVGLLWKALFPSGLSFSRLSLLLAVLLLTGFFVLGRRFPGNDIVLTLSTENLSLAQAPLAPVLALFRWLPTSLAAASIVYSQTGQMAMALADFIRLAALTAAAWLLVWWLIKYFLPLWQALAAGRGRVASARRPSAKSFSQAAPLLKSRFGAMVYKEYVSLWRVGRNAFWLLFLLLIWVAYIGFNYSVQSHLRRYGDNLSQLPGIVLALQLLILVYFISSLALRFVFPTFSAERNTAWIFASSPVSKTKILWAKFCFFIVLFGGFSLLAEAANAYLLQLPPPDAGLFLLLSLSAALLVTALALYFGARYPNFETDDPQALSTSIAGLVFVFCGAVYGALCAYVYYLYQAGSGAGFVLIFILASLLASWVLVSAGAGAIEYLDFVENQN